MARVKMDDGICVSSRYASKLLVAAVGKRLAAKKQSHRGTMPRSANQLLARPPGAVGKGSTNPLGTVG